MKPIIDSTDAKVTVEENARSFSITWEGCTSNYSLDDLNNKGKEQLLKCGSCQYCRKIWGIMVFCELEECCFK